MIKHVEHHVGTDNIYWNDEKNIVFDDENTVRETLRDPCTQQDPQMNSCHPRL